MWSRQWWKEATERAVKSAAQAVVLSWALGDQLLNALAVDWQAAGGFAAGAVLLSYLTSFGSIAFGSRSSASAVDTNPQLPHLTSDELMELAEQAAEREKR